MKMTWEIKNKTAAEIMNGMINEKPEMGFTEYLNAHYYKRRFVPGQAKQFYIQQASALERALGIEDNKLAQSFIRSFHKTYTIMLDDYMRGGLIEWEGCGKADSGFINYILSQRMLILEHLKTYNRMKGPISPKLPVENVEEQKVHEFLEYVGKSGRALLKEMEWYDGYIWNTLTEGKPWIKVSLTELKEKYGYPDRSEVDVLVDEELEWLKVLGVKEYKNGKKN